MQFEGVYTVLITPFHEDGSFNEQGLQQLIDAQIAAKVTGIVVLGTTSETPTLTDNEKRKIIELARSKIKSPMQLIVGTGTYSTQTTIEETKQAEDLGADGALVVTPYYNKPTQEGLFLHYKALALSTHLPIIPYNIQGRTGQNMETATLKRLAEFPQIVGVKEASGNILQMMDVIDSVIGSRPDFKILSGDDNLTLPLMAIGGHGIFSVVSNLVPSLVNHLYHFCKSHQWEEARTLHYQLLPLFRAAFIETNPVPIKTLMNYEGLPAGPCRLPLSPLTPEHERSLRHILETLKLPLLSHR